MGPWWGPGYPVWGVPPYYGYYGGIYSPPIAGGFPMPSFNYNTTIIQVPSESQRVIYPAEDARTLTCRKGVSSNTYSCTYP